MNEYMADINLPKLSKELIALIPRQICIINRLMQSGKLSTYTLSMDRTKLWVMIRADNENEAINVLRTFPFYPYIDFYIYKLALNNIIPSLAPRLSLN